MAKNVVIEQHGREITKRGLCEVSGKEYVVTVTVSQYIRWQYDNVKIQEAMPDLDPKQREFMISGTTPLEWERMFPPEEDD